MRVLSLQELKRVFRDEGWTGLWIRALSRTVYRRLILVERMLDQPGPSLETDVQMTFGLLQPDEVDEYCLLRNDAMPEMIRNRLRSENLCFVARCANRLVAVCWAAVHSARVEYLETGLVLAPGDVYLFDSFTSPDYRGRNVAGTRGSYMIRYFRDAGYKRLIAAVLPENNAALQPTAKLGYRPYAIAGRWKFGPWRHNFLRLLAR